MQDQQETGTNESAGNGQTPDRMYVITRADLPVGLQAAQAVHAAFEFSVQHRFITSGWLRESNYLVVVTALDEAMLEMYATAALQAGLRVTLVHEPDCNDELTAIAIEPSPEARKLCSNLPLLGKGYEKVPVMVT